MTNLLFPKGMQLADTIASMRTLGESGANVLRVFSADVKDDSVSFGDLLVACNGDGKSTLSMYTHKGMHPTIAEILLVGCQGLSDGLGSKRGRVMITAAYLTAKGNEALSGAWDKLAKSDTMLVVSFAVTASRLPTYATPVPKWDTDDKDAIVGFSGITEKTERLSSWHMRLGDIVATINMLAEGIILAEKMSPKMTPTTEKSDDIVLSEESLSLLV